MSKELYCPACGVDVQQLTEDYCFDCFQDRETQLQLSQAEYDFWNSLTEAEKTARIKWSMA